MPCHLHLTHVINTDKPGHRYIFFEFDFFHLFEGATLKFVLPENIFFKTYFKAVTALFREIFNSFCMKLLRRNKEI